LRHGGSDQDDRKFVLVEGRAYRLDTACIAVDVDRFDALLAQAAQAEPHAAMKLLAAADAMVRGEYLAGLDYPWVHGERRRVAEARVGALAALASLQLEHGRHEAAALSGRRWATLDPFSERACVVEMRALAAVGDLAAAERRFRGFEALLLDELGVGPGAATVRAYRELGRGVRVGTVGLGVGERRH